MRRPSFNAITNVGLLVAAVFVVWQTQQSRPKPPEPAKSLDDLAAVIDAGIVEGTERAVIDVVELMDFQCPFCRQWSATLDSLEAEYPGSVRVSFHHWPLPNHKHATAAAIAAECAYQQGRFTAMRQTLYELQPQIGVLPWTAFAVDAAVPDTAAFAECIQQPAEAFPRIAAGIALAEQQGARGTPTVWVNGSVSRPTLQELRELVAPK